MRVTARARATPARPADQADQDQAAEHPQALSARPRGSVVAPRNAGALGPRKASCSELTPNSDLVIIKQRSGVAQGEVAKQRRLTGSRISENHDGDQPHAARR